MKPSQANTEGFDSIEKRAFLVGGIALAASAAGAFFQPAQFFQSYLVGYVFWISIALGSLAIVLLHNLVGGGWGMAIRRTLESSTRTLPLMLVLIVPLAFGLPHLYHWAHPEAVAADEILQHKAPYLNVPFFWARTALYFALWIGLAWLANKRAAAHEASSSASTAASLRTVSGPGLVLYGLTVTFASIDWVMSLEPHWFSTMYGFIFMLGQALAALSLAIVVLLLISKRAPLAGFLTDQHSHDLGNLMLAFVMLWSYVAFSQFLIIWAGNLPEEIPWYITRFEGGYGYIALALVAFHFVLPFLLLLSRQNKRRLHVLGKLAALVVAVRFLDTFWTVTPAFHHGEFHIHWMDLAVPIGIGGLWVGLFVRQLKARPLLPAGARPAEGAHV